MIFHIRTFAAAAVVVASFAGFCVAQSPSTATHIQPEADMVLRQLGEHIKRQGSVVLRLTDTIDDVQPDGRKIQFAHNRELTVVRPDKLKVETTGDVTNRTLWKDGKTVTVLDRDHNVYAQFPDAGTIEETVDRLQNRFGMSLPAADFLTADFYQTMTEGCESVEYVGLGYVGPEKCHHLAFSRANIDWQLWVATGDKPAVRKMVITYKQLPGEPQYTVHVVSVEDGASIDPAVFTSSLPDDAEKINFQPAAKSE